MTSTEAVAEMRKQARVLTRQREPWSWKQVNDLAVTLDGAADPDLTRLAEILRTVNGVMRKAQRDEFNALMARLNARYPEPAA